MPQIIENPKPLTPYFVESDETGERVVCELIRGVWQRVDSTPLFFAYEHDDIEVVAEAHKCECGEWCMYPMKFGTSEAYDIYCENCAPF